MTNPPDDGTAARGDANPTSRLTAEQGDARATDALVPAVQGHALVQQFRLRVVDGPDSGQTQVSGRERLVIGTHESADLVLTDPTVSRFHCEITIAEGKAALRDLDSRNGTVVGDVEVVLGQLRDGATLTLGQTRLRFELTANHVKVPVSDRESFGAMRGRSRAMRSVFAKLERAARKEVTVLLIGETGTGKDVAAEAIHRESKRAHQPFAIVDCGSIPGPLLESELFGYERGAFTGADRARAGAFEAATGGTLFLDEIGELALDLQPKLLRVLEDRSVQRLGSTKRIPVDVMLIAATNRNLRAEVNCHRFRADLYYRLAVLEVTLPPLRTRPEDLPDLVDAVLDNIGADPSAAAALRDREFIAGLTRHTWPGNVRELRNYLERCLAMEQPLPLSPEDDDLAPPPIDTSQPFKTTRDRWLRYFERNYLQEQLRVHGGNVSAVARASGVDRIHLYRMLARCGLR